MTLTVAQLASARILPEAVSAHRGLLSSVDSKSTSDSNITSILPRIAFITTGGTIAMVHGANGTLIPAQVRSHARADEAGRLNDPKGPIGGEAPVHSIRVGSHLRGGPGGIAGRIGVTLSQPAVALLQVGANDVQLSTLSPLPFPDPAPAPAGCMARSCTSSLLPSEVRPPVPPSQDGTQLLAAVPGLDKVVNVTSITAAASIDSSDATPGKVPTWPPQGPPGQKVPMLPVIVLAIWPI